MNSDHLHSSSSLLPVKLERMSSEEGRVWDILILEPHLVSNGNMDPAKKFNIWLR